MNEQYDLIKENEWLEEACDVSGLNKSFRLITVSEISEISSELVW